MKTSHRSLRSCIGLFAALSLVAAACGGSDEGGTDSSPDTAVTTPAAEPAVDTAPATEDPVDTAEPTASPPPDSAAPAETDPPVELTASARGVTADTISLGYSYIDFDELVDLGLAPAGWGDQEATFQAIVDDLNANGGILGRSIEVIYRPYSVLGTEGAEAVCLELTQDNEVFAVLGGFVGPAEPANTCIVGRGDTVLVGGVQSEERLADATAPWVTERAVRTRLADVLVSLLAAQGELEGRKIAVVASIDAEDVRDDVAAVLSAAGAEPVDVLQSEAPIGDFVAEDANWATLGERLRGSEADTLLLVGNPSAGIRNNAALGLDLDIWALDQGSLTSLGTSVTLEDARGVITAGSLSGQDLWDDETMAGCREAFAAAQPDVEVTEPDDVQEGDEDIARGLVGPCQFLSLFEIIATEAGPELTNQSFAEAVSGLTQFSIPGQPFASLGDKFDSIDSFALLSFNPDLGAEGGFDTITDIIDVTP